MGQAPGSSPVSVTAVTERATVRPGEVIRLALDVKAPEGIHLQSDKPRDPSLIPLLLSMAPPTGVSVVDIAYPKSVDFQLIGFDQPLAVFEGEFAVGVRVRVAKDAAPGPITIPARFQYQACNNSTCFNPVRTPVSWTVEVGTSAGAAQHADVFSRVDWTRAAAPPVAPVAAAPVPAPAAVEVTGDVVAQFDRFTILGVTNYTDVNGFVEFIRNAEAGVQAKGAFEDRGPLAILAIVFLGGLALNLTPCVLPMIPINLAIIGAGAKEGRRGRGFALGSAYGAAMAVVYGVLGVVVILTAGTFGAINASAWFNIAIALLFVVLGLAMFDVISIDFSRFSSRIRFDPQSRGTLMLAFGMGAVAALLAGACVAPVVVQVVVFASDLYAGGSSVALALPFVLGLGMALPWPIAGAGMAALPKPGAWMVRVKQVMGVFILGTAAYYGYLAYEIVSSRWVDPADVRAGVQEQLKAGWYPSLSEGLRVAERDRTLVLVDFWASWCKNCLVMDRTTLKDPAVVDALSKYTRIKFQAEDLNASPVKDLLKRVESVGLPTYVILRPKNAS